MYVEGFLYHIDEHIKEHWRLLHRGFFSAHLVHTCQ